MSQWYGTPCTYCLLSGSSIDMFSSRVFVVYLSMRRRERTNGMMLLLHVALVLVLRLEVIEANKDNFVVQPFYLRVRIHDAHSATVLFEVEEESDQRTCRMYKFTVRRNREYPYSMPEQNLASLSNSLELKKLDAGQYRVCAIICSEELRVPLQQQDKKNRSTPITACVEFEAHRSHFLVLTLYVLVLILLTLSQITYSLRKRKIQARIKLALIEVETSLQKWRSTQTNLSSAENTPSYSTLHSIVRLPASPVEHSLSSPASLTTNELPQTLPAIHFHLEPLNETFTAVSETC